MWKICVLAGALSSSFVHVFAQNTSLPVREFSVTETGDAFCILLTGDGGWKDLSVNMAYFYQQHNLPVVGIDVSSYLWEPHDPAEIAHDLQSLITLYQKKWYRRKVFLVGYSLGANVLPAAFNQLSREYKATISQVVLIAPTRFTDYEVRLLPLLTQNKGAYPVLPELKKMAFTPVFIVCDEEPESLSSELKTAAIEYRVLKGGHDFGGNMALLSEVIWDKMRNHMPE